MKLQRSNKLGDFEILPMEQKKSITCYWLLVYNEADCYLFIEAPGKSKKNVLQM